MDSAGAAPKYIAVIKKWPLPCGSGPCLIWQPYVRSLESRLELHAAGVRVVDEPGQVVEVDGTGDAHLVGSPARRGHQGLAGSVAGSAWADAPSAISGVKPSERTAARIGPMACGVWVTVSTRCIRLNSSAVTPAIPPSFLRSRPSSVGQSTLQDTNGGLNAVGAHCRLADGRNSLICGGCAGATTRVACMAVAVGFGIRIVVVVTLFIVVCVGGHEGLSNRGQAIPQPEATIESRHFWSAA